MLSLEQRRLAVKFLRGEAQRFKLNGLGRVDAEYAQALYEAADALEIQAETATQAPPMTVVEIKGMGVIALDANAPKLVVQNLQPLPAFNTSPSWLLLFCRRCGYHEFAEELEAVSNWNTGIRSCFATWPGALQHALIQVYCRSGDASAMVYFCRVIYDSPLVRQAMLAATLNLPSCLEYCDTITDHDEVWQHIRDSANPEYLYRYCRGIKDRPEMWQALVETGDAYWCCEYFIRVAKREQIRDIAIKLVEHLEPSTC